MLSVLQAIIFAEMKGSLHTLFETLHLEDFRGKLQTPIFSDPHLAGKAKKQCSGSLENVKNLIQNCICRTKWGSLKMGVWNDARKDCQYSVITL